MKKEFIYKVFSRIPTIETERLVLRQVRISDVEDVYEYAKCDDVTKYLLWTPHVDKEHTQNYLSYVQERYKMGDFYDWAVVCKENGKMIGTCGFTRFDCRNNAAEVGYVINPAYHGVGIATEAVGRVIRFGFDELDLNRIEGRFMIENNASRRVMDKNGMKYEGTVRQGIFVKGEYRDVGVCSILASEHEKR